VRHLLRAARVGEEPTKRGGMRQLIGEPSGRSLETGCYTSPTAPQKHDPERMNLLLNRQRQQTLISITPQKVAKMCKRGGTFMYDGLFYLATTMPSPRTQDAVSIKEWATPLRPDTIEGQLRIWETTLPSSPETLPAGEELRESPGRGRALFTKPVRWDQTRIPQEGGLNERKRSLGNLAKAVPLISVIESRGGRWIALKCHLPRPYPCSIRLRQETASACLRE